MRARKVSAIERALNNYPVNVFVIGEVPVIAQFVLNISNNEHATRYAYSQPRNIENRKEFILPNTPEGSFDVVV